MKLSFDNDCKNVMFGGDWVLFCNAHHVYKGQDIKLEARARGRNGVLYVTLDK